MAFMSIASNQPSVKYLPDEYPLAQKSKVMKAVESLLIFSSKWIPSVLLPEWEWQYTKNIWGYFKLDSLSQGWKIDIINHSLKAFLSWQSNL